MELCRDLLAEFDDLRCLILTSYTDDQAMLGFAIDGVDIRYDVPLTLFSAAIAIVVVLVGLAIVVR
ncbi:MHYT domain-containing protein, partial [Nocardia cyriacigeorgica]|uniref:MHYT domain-containing protein n=1 Tax=Nocardia cyriacigeorgica TaxID=135487 RepID=UPI002458B30F